MPPRKWARVLQSGAHGLRRGAWYPVVNDSSSRIVILDVSKKNVPVDRSMLEISERKSEEWSVVKWDAARPLPHRMSERKLPRIYAVCPICRARSGELPAGIKELKCDECGFEKGINWDDSC